MRGPHTLKGNENGGGLLQARALWSAQAVLAPSLYEAMLRSRRRLRSFAPGNVRNVGYAVRTGMVRTAYPTCSWLGVVFPGPNVAGRGGYGNQATNRR